MKREKLITLLNNLVEETNQQGYVDLEKLHYEADNALLDYINDKEISELYTQIHKWYA